MCSNSLFVCFILLITGFVNLWITSHSHCHCQNGGHFYYVYRLKDCCKLTVVACVTVMCLYMCSITFNFFFHSLSLSLSLSLLFLAFNNSNINYRSATALFGLIWVHVQDIQWAYNTYVQICAHVGTHTPEFQTCVPLVPFDLYNISSLNCIIHTIQPVSLLSFFLYLLWSLLLLIKNGNKL